MAKISNEHKLKEEDMSKRVRLAVSLSLGLMGLMGLMLGPAIAQDKEVVIGLQCDRTGATQIVGTTICPAYHDYVALVNSKGGVEGYKIKVIEIDHEYKVPPAMEAHERFKKDGAVLEGVYGTPHIAALNKKLEEDKILGTSPGFGTAAAADGKKYPYTFPIAASYWSQGAAAVKFAKDKLGGSLKDKKIAYLYFDNPAGKEPPKEMDSTVYYNRGVLIAATHVEALRNAIKAKGGAMPTSEDVKKGMESIKGVTLGGLMPPLEITPTDHEGGGWCQIWTVKGGKLVMVKDWFQGFRPVITKQIAADASKS